MLKIEFKTDNAAFENNPDETANLLRKIAEQIDHGQTKGEIRDSNGNQIGEWSLT